VTVSPMMISIGSIFCCGTNPGYCKFFLPH
jgi:hypothetical protein